MNKISKWTIKLNNGIEYIPLLPSEIKPGEPYMEIVTSTGIRFKTRHLITNGGGGGGSSSKENKS